MTENTSLDLYRPNVGIMLINTDGLILLCERADIKGAWQMPQGGIEQGETVSDAGLRELWEETGIKVDDKNVLGESKDWFIYDYPANAAAVKKYGFVGQRQKWLAVAFNGQDDDINLSVYEQEFANFKWASAQEVLNSIVDFKRPVYQAVIQEFSRFLAPKH